MEHQVITDPAMVSSFELFLRHNQTTVYFVVQVLVVGIVVLFLFKQNRYLRDMMTSFKELIANQGTIIGSFKNLTDGMKADVVVAKEAMKQQIAVVERTAQLNQQEMDKAHQDELVQLKAVVVSSTKSAIGEVADTGNKNMMRMFAMILELWDIFDIEDREKLVQYYMTGSGFEEGLLQAARNLPVRRLLVDGKEVKIQAAHQGFIRLNELVKQK
jgi:hypothetical protein